MKLTVREAAELFLSFSPEEQLQITHNMSPNVGQLHKALIDHNETLNELLATKGDFIDLREKTLLMNDPKFSTELYAKLIWHFHGLQDLLALRKKQRGTLPEPLDEFLSAMEHTDVDEPPWGLLHIFKDQPPEETNIASEAERLFQIYHLNSERERFHAEWRQAFGPERAPRWIYPELYGR